MYVAAWARVMCVTRKITMGVFLILYSWSGMGSFYGILTLLTSMHF